MSGNEIGDALKHAVKTTRYEIRYIGKMFEDVVVDVAPDDLPKWRRDSHTFETLEEAEAEAEAIRSRKIRNTKSREKRKMDRAERIARLKEYERKWNLPISCILDRVKNEEVDAILDGLDWLVKGRQGQT